MGDRVLFQVVGDTEHSPVMYGHNSGSYAPEICARILLRMVTRPGDVNYTAARLMQEMIGDDEGDLGFGMWHAGKILTADDSHGDAGVVLVHVNETPMRFEALGGYLTSEQLNKKA